MSEQNKIIGKRIKNCRKELGMTQKDLAQKIGCAEITIRQYESGRNAPKIDTRIAIAKALGVSYDALFRPFGEETDYMFEMAAKYNESELIGKALADMDVVTLTDDKKHMRMYGDSPSEYIDMNAAEYSRFKYHMVKQLKSVCKNYVEISLIHDHNSDRAIGLDPEESEASPE